MHPLGKSSNFIVSILVSGHKDQKAGTNNKSLLTLNFVASIWDLLAPSLIYIYLNFLQIHTQGVPEQAVIMGKNYPFTKLCYT